MKGLFVFTSPPYKLSPLEYLYDKLIEAIDDADKIINLEFHDDITFIHPLFLIHFYNFYEYLLDILNTACSDGSSPNALVNTSLPMFTKKTAFLI